MELKKRKPEEVVAYLSIKHAEWLVLKADMLKALEAAEWGGHCMSYEHHCPVCGEDSPDNKCYKGTGEHRPDCILAAAIKKARGEDT